MDKKKIFLWFLRIFGICWILYGVFVIACSFIIISNLLPYFESSPQFIKNIILLPININTNPVPDHSWAEVRNFSTGSLIVRCSFAIGIAAVLIYMGFCLFKSAKELQKKSTLKQ